MILKEVPVFNEDGSIEFTQVITEAEAQILLQFALNFLTARGMAVMKAPTTADDKTHYNS